MKCAGDSYANTIALALEKSLKVCVDGFIFFLLIILHYLVYMAGNISMPWVVLGMPAQLKGNAGSKRQHVHGCSLVRARKFYGYHTSEELFVKICLYPFGCYTYSHAFLSFLLYLSLKTLIKSLAIIHTMSLVLQIFFWWYSWIFAVYLNCDGILFIQILYWCMVKFIPCASSFQGGAVLDKSLQPHESHIPYILQFLVSDIYSWMKFDYI